MSCSKGIAHRPRAGRTQSNHRISILSTGPGRPGPFRIYSVVIIITIIIITLESRPQVFSSKPPFHSGLLSKPTPRPKSTRYRLTSGLNGFSWRKVHEHFHAFVGNVEFSFLERYSKIQGEFSTTSRLLHTNMKKRKSHFTKMLNYMSICHTEHPHKKIVRAAPSVPDKELTH